MSASSASAVPVLSDFPDWLGPVPVKELRQGLRTHFFQIGFMGLHLAMLTWTMFMLGLAENGGGAVSSSLVPAQWTFWLIVGGALTVSSLRGLGAIRREKSNHTFDLLLVSKLSSWKILLGKWSAIMLQSGVFLASLLPYGLMRYFSGGVELLEDAVLALAMFSGAALLTALAVFLSLLHRAAFIGVIAVLVCAAPLYLGLLVLAMVFLVKSLWGHMATGAFALLYYSFLYAFIILGFAAQSNAGRFDSDAARLKGFGWLLLVPPLLWCLGEADKPVVLALAGVALPGAGLLVFYSLGSGTVWDRRAVIGFEQRGRWGRAAAWMFAPDLAAGTRNGLFMALAAGVVIALPFVVPVFSLPAPVSFLFLLACLFATVAPPVLIAQRTASALKMDFFFNAFLFLLLWIVVMVGLALVAFRYTGAVPWRELACLFPTSAFMMACWEGRIGVVSLVSLSVQCFGLAVLISSRVRAWLDTPLCP